MLFFGKIYTFYSTKWVFLTAITVFEIGSAVCGAAPTSKAFIVGRAIAGLGSAGIFNGAINVMVHSVPLAKRPMFQGLFGAVFGVASVVGPLLGGAFTQYISWRWCFYINLPIGGITIVALAFILKIPTPPSAAHSTFRQVLARLDLPGTAVFLPGCICLLLALQWGGTTYAWKNGRIIALLVLAVVLLGAFIAIQIYQGESATVPPRIFKQRTVAAGFCYTICVGSSMMAMVYYIPIWFQAIKGVSAVESGIRVIALILSLVAGSIISGGITFKTGYYAPAMIVSPIVMSIGAGLLTTWQVDTPSSKWIGYQIFYGFGIGLGMQQANMGVQTVLSKKDVPIGSSLVFFGQTLGGAIFISVAQNVFTNKLKDGLMLIKGLDVPLVLDTGATDIRNVVPTQLLGEVLVEFNGALMDALRVGLAMACLSILGALCIEWRSIKNGEGQGEKTAAVEETMTFEETKTEA